MRNFEYDCALWQLNCPGLITGIVIRQVQNP